MRAILLKMTLSLLFLGSTVPAQGAAPKIVSEKAASLSGKVETSNEAAMWWYRLNTGKGKTLLIGAVYSFSGANGDCLEKAEASGNPVTITGKLTMYDNGTGGFDENGVQCTAVAAAPTGSGKQLKLNDKIHSQFMQDEKYTLADTLLNATWKQIKTNVSDARYRQLLAEQRQWAGSGRDEAASKYSASMSDVAAFTKAMLDRTSALADVVSTEPQRGTYSSKYSSFTVITSNGDVLIQGDAYSPHPKVCGFGGEGKASKGWITMKHEDMPDFYLLFTPKGAQIVYTTSEHAQGCPTGVGFNDIYVRK